MSSDVSHDTPQRLAGILAHPTCLPGPFGCGELGKETFEFLRFLHSTGQTAWQVLPLNPTECAPYSGTSAFALNPILISPAEVVKSGAANEKWLKSLISEFDETKVNYLKVSAGLLNELTSSHVNFKYVLSLKKKFIRQVFDKLHQTNEPSTIWDAFCAFCENHSSWLNTYVLFVVIEQKLQLDGGPWRCWTEWPDKYRRYSPDVGDDLDNNEILYQKYLQFESWRQWQIVKDYAHSLDITIIGDCAIYMALHSADVWSNTSSFDIDQITWKPRYVSGVPPDYFSADGQLWGHPVYNWRYLKESNFDWWYERFRVSLLLTDLIRIDHFRGFASYWAVPYDHAITQRNAKNGTWENALGEDLFSTVLKRLYGIEIGHHKVPAVKETIHRNIETAAEGMSCESHTVKKRRISETADKDILDTSPSACKLFFPPFIVEDLGDITPDVKVLLELLKFPNMKVLQFAFGDYKTAKANKNNHLPHFHQYNSIVYPGTHDNDTCIGWWRSLDNVAKQHFVLYSGYDTVEAFEKQTSPPWHLLHTTMMSVSALAIIPLQDVLLLDERFNDPGDGLNDANWRWQLKSISSLEKVKSKLLDLTRLSGRLSDSISSI